MIKVHLLVSKVLGYYEYCSLPVLINKQLLRDRGIIVRVFTGLEPKLFDSDLTVFSSTFTKELRRTGETGSETTERVYKTLDILRDRTGSLFYFDNADSTSAYGQFRYLPYVDKYLKPWLLKDKKLYQRKFYRDRMFTDYYHSQLGVEDTKDSPDRVLPEDNELNKIQLAWNSSLSDYGRFGRYRRRLSSYSVLFNFYSTRFYPPKRSRSNKISMRFSTQYNLNTISYQRLKIAEIGSQLGVSTDRLPRKDYLIEMQNSKLAVSPFGYGEVCFRDFETIANGAALVKPDMSHMDTWPNLFIENKTYIPFEWDCSNLESAMMDALQNDAWLEIAENAQTTYKKYLFGRDGQEEFCDHFANIFDLT